MKKIALFSVFFLIFSFSNFAQKKTATSTASKGIAFFSGSWKELLAEAQRQGKPFFVDFYTDWCGPCKVMAKTTFKDENVGKYVNTNMLAAKINAEEGEGINLSEQYGVDAYPSIYFFDKNGKLIGKEVGSQGATAFQEVLEKYVNMQTKK
jgi:thioredoxin 1